MASSEEIAPLLPETLPEDFGDWDSETSPAPSGGSLAARKTGKPLLPPAKLEAVWAIRKPRRISRIPDGKASSFRVPPCRRLSLSNSQKISSIGKKRLPLRRFVLTPKSRTRGKPIVPPMQSRPRNCRWQCGPSVRCRRAAQASDSVPLAPAVDEPQRGSADWDSVTSEKPSPVKSKEWDAWEADHSLGDTSKPLGQSAGREASAPQVADGPRASGSAAPPSFLVKQQESANVLVDESPSHASHKPEAGDASNRVAVAPSWPTDAMVDGMHDSPELTETLKREADEIFKCFLQRISKIRKRRGRRNGS